MINGDKLVKDMLDLADIKILANLDINMNHTLSEAADILEDYFEKRAYKSLQDMPKNTNDKVYMRICKIIYKLLPIY